MTKLTFAEYDAFARDVGRPFDPIAELNGLTIRKDSAPDSTPDSTPEAVSTLGDAINPSHYKIGGIETIDYMRAKSTPEEFEGYLRLSAIKYLSRVGHKHGDHDAARAEEYKKALWFIERLVKEIGP